MKWWRYVIANNQTCVLFIPTSWRICARNICTGRKRGQQLRSSRANTQEQFFTMRQSSCHVTPDNSSIFMAEQDRTHTHEGNLSVSAGWIKLSLVVVLIFSGDGVFFFPRCSGVTCVILCVRETGAYPVTLTLQQARWSCNMWHSLLKMGLFVMFLQLNTIVSIPYL